MSDLIQKTYATLNCFLGEQNKNLKRIPEKWEPLLRAVEKLVMYSYEYGRAKGQEQTKKIYHRMFAPMVSTNVKYPQFDPKQFEEKKNESNSGSQMPEMSKNETSS